MTREFYRSKGFRRETLELIDTGNAIISEYVGMGYVLTLRQLYYQFVARAIIENSERSYKRLGKIVSDARLAGMMDWEAIEDRTRGVQEVNHWEHPRDIIYACAEQFRIDKWWDQPKHVEVWVEKEALAGVLHHVCRDLDVPFLSCRGYPSQSEMWRAGQRIKSKCASSSVVIHLGDHDPSGIDMTRDIEERLWLFSGEPVHVQRIALNMDQVEEYNPPPNPTKFTDSRAGDYVMRYGYSSWELDALEPQVLEQLTRDAVIAHRDEELWQKSIDVEHEHRRQLRELAAEME